MTNICLVTKPIREFIHLQRTKTIARQLIFVISSRIISMLGARVAFEPAPIIDFCTYTDIVSNFVFFSRRTAFLASKHNDCYPFANVDDGSKPFGTEAFAWSFDWRNKTGARDSNLFRAGTRAYRRAEGVGERNTSIVFCLLVSRRSLRGCRADRGCRATTCDHPSDRSPATPGRRAR